MPDRRYSAEEVDAAVAALANPERFARAQEIVTHAAPGLQRVLDEALAEGGWFGDTVAIAKRTGAPVVAIVELAGEIGEEGVQTFDPNIGGTVEFDWGSARLTPAWHTPTTPKGTVNTPAGLVIEIGGRRIYHLGDTALFSDLALPKHRGHIDVALMCIGGHYTMDRFDAVVAAELVGADQIIPCHYNPFPPIETDVQAFKSDVQNAGAGEVVVLEPGDTHST